MIKYTPSKPPDVKFISPLKLADIETKLGKHHEKYKSLINNEKFFWFLK